MAKQRVLTAYIFLWLLSIFSFFISIFFPLPKHSHEQCFSRLYHITLSACTSTFSTYRVLYSRFFLLLLRYLFHLMCNESVYVMVFAPHRTHISFQEISLCTGLTFLILLLQPQHLCRVGFFSFILISVLLSLCLCAQEHCLLHSALLRLSMLFSYALKLERRPSCAFIQLHNLRLIYVLYPFYCRRQRRRLFIFLIEHFIDIYLICTQPPSLSHRSTHSMVQFSSFRN